MAVNCSPFGPKPQFEISSGVPAIGNKLFFYAAGSVNTKQNTYTDSTGSVANANPIILNSLGQPTAEIWFTDGQGYKVVYAPSTDTDPPTSPIWTIDNLRGINDTTTSIGQWIVGPAPTYTSATQFTLLGDQTSIFTVGRRVKTTNTSGTIYSSITASAYGALTTVTVVNDSGILDTGLSAVSYSILSSTNSAVPSVLNPITSINGGGFGIRNLLPNSSAQVAQRTAAPSLTTSRLIGQVDCFAMWASGGAVSAGTLAQVTSALCGTTGNAARAAGVTLTGSGVVSGAVRMEAKDAAKYKNKTCSFQIGVAHDVGSSVNYTVIIKKATVADNWGSMTTIATSGVTAVATATGTVLKFENQAMGDCSNGIEIEIQAACGAVTTKNFDFTEWSLDIGSVAPAFNGNAYDYDFRSCARYLPRINSISTSDNFEEGRAASAIQFRVTCRLQVRPRIPPTSIAVSAAGDFAANVSGATPTSAITFLSANYNIFRFYLTSSGLTTGEAGEVFFNSASAYLMLLGAELF